MDNHDLYFKYQKFLLKRTNYISINVDNDQHWKQGRLYVVVLE